MIASHLVHAAGETGPTETGTHAVVLGARNEEELCTLTKLLSELEIPHRAVREPDPPYHNQLMAVGIFPTTDRNKLKPVTKRLRLLQRSKK